MRIDVVNIIWLQTCLPKTPEYFIPTSKTDKKMKQNHKL
jgi:hypothetical protein